MPEHPPGPDNQEQLERERRESTDLGYRDTEEQRAYEEAESKHVGSQPEDDDTAAPAEEADSGR